jgi:hypothetical protein
MALAGGTLPLTAFSQDEAPDQGLVADEQILLKQVMTDKRSVYCEQPRDDRDRERRVLAGL